MISRERYHTAQDISKSNRLGVSMSNARIQMIVRLTEEFRQVMEEEGIRRHSSFQQMIMDGLKLLYATPPDYELAAATFVKRDSNATPEQVAERKRWTALWQRYMNEMPHVKAAQLAEVMKLDLLHYRSSRRKKNSGRKRHKSEERN
jgi:hypothetical protein